MASSCHIFTIPVSPFRPNRRCLREFRSSLLPLPAALSSPVSSLPETLSEIHNSCIIACLRAKNGMLAIEAARAALKGGISVIEVMMSTPDALLVMKGLLQEYPFSIIGAGTILNVDDARRAMSAGAKFLTSPGTVMVYPATILGGNKYISALKKPFPHIPMVASQGILLDSIKPYIEAGASAVILSDAIFDQNAMNHRDFDTIRKLAALAICEVAR